MVKLLLKNKKLTHPNLEAIIPSGRTNIYLPSWLSIYISVSVSLFFFAALAPSAPPSLFINIALTQSVFFLKTATMKIS